MMTNTDFPSIYLLLISNAALLAAASIAVVRFQRLVRQSQQFWNSPIGSALNEQQTAGGDKPQESVEALQRHITNLQSEVSRLAEKGREQRTPPPGLPIENAVRMAKHGASIDELTRNCGLNFGEARLVKKLHEKARPASATA